MLLLLRVAPHLPKARPAVASCAPLRTFCAAPPRTEDLCTELIQRALGPPQERRREALLERDRLDSERRCAVKKVADHERRWNDATEKIGTLQAKLADLNARESALTEDFHASDAQRTAKAKEYHMHAEAVGIDDADARLELARRNPTAPQNGTALTAYAERHRQCLAVCHEISNVQADAVKVTQIIGELQEIAGAAETKWREEEACLAELDAQLGSARAAVSDVDSEIGEIETDGARMRAAAAWAQRVSQHFLRPTADTLPLLLLQRHQAILAAASGAQDAGLAVLRELECSSAELQGFPGIERRLRSGGFSALELRGMGFPNALLAAAGFTAAELLEVPLTAAELRDLGFGAVELRKTGLDAATLRVGGFTAAELGKAGCAVTTLIDAGFTAAQLRDAGVAAADLKSAGVAAAELIQSGYTLEQLVEACFTSKQLRDAGFTAIQLKAAGFSSVAFEGEGFVAENIDHEAPKVEGQFLNFYLARFFKKAF